MQKDGEVDAGRIQQMISISFQHEHEEGPVTKSQHTHNDGSRKHTRRIAGMLKVVLVVAGVVGASVPAMAGKAKETSGTADAKYHKTQVIRAWE